MARTLIDIDEEALAAAAHQLGTSTKVATVNAALQLAAGTSERIASHRRLVAGLDSGDLDDPDVMAGAWR